MTNQQDDQQTEVRDAPKSFWGIVRQLGPGLIVAGAIVGSGELIATTATGAKAGFWLLWLIIIGCLIKVFVQVELGRYSISSGQTTMTALDRVPGPRVRGRGNWLIWFWFLMFLAGIAQLGGIVGGVGQALSIAAPLTEYGKQYDEIAQVDTQLAVRRAQYDRLGASTEPEQVNAALNSIIAGETEFMVLRSAMHVEQGDETPGYDAGGSTFLSRLRLSELDAVMKSTENVEPAVRVNLLRALHDPATRLSLLKQNPGTQAGQIAVAEAEIRDIRVAAPQELHAMADMFVAVRSLPALDPPNDDKIWAAIVAILTSIILFYGRFGLIQSFSTVLVGLFTLITIVNLFLLQSAEAWAFSMEEILNGLMFRLPPATGEGGSTSTLAIALATFGIIGVGASELVAYPYWCLEKGYGKFAGPRDDSDGWAKRANGWMRIMRIDAWCSMVVYTFATVAFYLLGASVLGRTGLTPEGNDMIRYLAVMYSPVFGQWAGVLFLFGAFAVLYSTFFVATAGHARTVSDVVQVLGMAKREESAYQWRVRWMSALFPIICFLIFWKFPAPVVLILLSGLMQALMLPMLAFAALWFRYRGIDRRIAPTLFWDLFLFVSAAGMFLFGLWAGWNKIMSFFSE